MKNRLLISLAFLATGCSLLAQTKINLGEITPAIPPWISADPGASTIYPYWNDTTNQVEWLSAAGYRAAIGGTTVGQNFFTAANPNAIRYARVNADNTITFLSAAQMVTDLGGSTVGNSIFSAANPSAIRFIRINADNTITFRTAAEMLSDIGGGSGGGDATLAGAQTFTGQKTFNLAPNIPPADISTVTTSNTSTPAVNVAYYGTVAANRAVTLPTAVDGDSVILNRVVFSGVYTLTFSTGVKRSGEANSTFTVLPVYPGVHTFVLKKVATDWILSDTVGLLHNDTATTDPTTGSDSTLGYTKRSLWTNTTTGGIFVCVDATASAAVWKRLDDGGTRSIATGGTGSTTAAGARVALNVITNAVGSTAIDWSLSGSHSKTLAANTTFTFTNDVDGETIVVAVTNTASNYTAAWPSVKWAGGAAPVLTTGAKTDVFTFTKVGSTIYGSVVQNCF